MNDKREEDIDFEPEEEFGTVGAAQAKLKKLKEELEKVKKERQEYLDGWQRCKADAVNSRKDIEARASRSAETLREALVHDIIPALDSFDMARDTDAWSAIDDGWRSGMERVRDQLIDALKRHGIERYGKIGDMLDHAIHEVVQETDDMPGNSGEIVKVLRAGYRSNGRVLRAAQVITKR